MPATHKVPVQIIPSVPNLRVFRKLDVERLSDEFIEKVGIEEGDYEYVDVDRPRDYPYVEEIMETTIGAALVSAEGEILAEWDGEDAFLKAEKARGSARVTFQMDFDDEDEAPARTGRRRPNDNQPDAS